MADETIIRELNMIDESNVTDDKNDCKISLKSSRNTIFSVVYTLNVPNFFILPEYDNTDYEVKSPSFEYANATWQFLFEADMGDIKNHSFAVCLVRLNYKNLIQMIMCRIELLDADGEKYDINCEAFTMDDEEVDKRYICYFNSKKPSYDRRDTLTFIIHLISEESFEELADPVPLLIKGDVETLSQDYKKLLQNGKNQDFTFKVADKEFRAHQDILMARCPAFENMLACDGKENEEGVIDVSDCDPQAMEQFLFYVYSGRVETLTKDNVLGLYHVADKFQMMPLKEDCSKFIKLSLSPSMICDVVLLALKYSDADLLKCATQYFVDHTSQILPTVGWMSLMKSNMIAANELFIKAANKWDCSKS